MDKHQSNGRRLRFRSVFFCRRCLLLVLPSVLVLLCWTYSQYSLPSTTRMRPVLPMTTKTPMPQETSGRYLVDTPVCQIPNVDPLDETVRKFVKPPEPILCNKDPPPLTYSDMDSVHLLLERQHLYGARPPLTTVSCCTRDISWNNDVVNRTKVHLRKIRKSPDCRQLTDSYTPRGVCGVEVICALNKKIVYRDYYHFTPLLPQVENESILRHPQHVRPSVLIFMFDSLSRLQFLRWFPRSRRLLNDRLEAFELGGFNKVGDNTWPNIVPMMTGMDEKQLRKLCAPNVTKNALDSCPFMWRDFKRAGYRTALAEDASHMGVFDYLKHGFERQPTDYYTRPTVLLSDHYIGYNHQLNTFFCEGTRNSYVFTFKFAHDLATRFADRPYWAFVAQTSYTHDFFNVPYHLDEPYYNLLETLLNSGALNNTVLVTMGDHGLRWGDERKTFIGGLEERLPLMSLYFPRWLRRRYPTAFHNLRANQRRLTTFQDIHATLLDLLWPEHTLATVDEREAPANASRISLFRRVSPLRRCHHVGIPDHFCTCLKSQEISGSDRRAALAAAAVVRAMNSELAAAPQCSQLQLVRVLKARISRQPDADQQKAGQFLRQMVTVQLQTLPGGANFEATVIGDGRQFFLSGSVSRLDRYGHLISCIRDHRLEKYCHCRDSEPGISPAAGATQPGGSLGRWLAPAADDRVTPASVSRPGGSLGQRLAPAAGDRVTPASVSRPGGSGPSPHRVSATAANSTLVRSLPGAAGSMPSMSPTATSTASDSVTQGAGSKPTTPATTTNKPGFSLGSIEAAEFDSTPTQLLSAGSDTPTQLPSARSDTPTQPLSAGSDTPTQLLSTRSDTPTQLLSAGSDTPTQLLSTRSDTPTQLLSAGSDTPTQLLPAGSDGTLAKLQNGHPPASPPVT